MLLKTATSTTIGIAFSATASGVSRSSSEPEAREQERHRDADRGRRATSPTSAFRPVTFVASQISAVFGRERSQIADGRRQEVRLEVEDLDRELPQREERDAEHDRRPDEAERRAAAIASRLLDHLLDVRLDAGRLDAAQRLAHLGDLGEERVGLARVLAASRAERRTSMTSVIRPGRGDITTTRSTGTPPRGSSA